MMDPDAATKALDIAENLHRQMQLVDRLANSERDKSPPDELADIIENMRKGARESLGEAMAVLAEYAGTMQLKERTQ